MVFLISKIDIMISQDFSTYNWHQRTVAVAVGRMSSEHLIVSRISQYSTPFRRFSDHCVNLRDANIYHAESPYLKCCEICDCPRAFILSGNIFFPSLQFCIIEIFWFLLLIQKLKTKQMKGNLKEKVNFTFIITIIGIIVALLLLIFNCKS